MKQEPDLYSVLSVDPAASDDEIRSAFRAAAKVNHPDRFLIYLQKIRATRRMQDLNHAYSVLQDPDQRCAYDARRNRARPFQSPRRGAERSEIPSVPPTAVQSRSSNHVAWWAAAWLLVIAVFGYFFARASAPSSILDYIAIAVVSLFFAPMVAVAIGLTVFIPIFVVGRAFRSSFADRQATASGGPIRILVDLTVRAALLAIFVFLLVKAFQAEIASDLLYLVLLGAAGSLAGELAAMLFYLIRRRSVVKTTAVLLRPEPVATD